MGRSYCSRWNNLAVGAMIVLCVGLLWLVRFPEVSGGHPEWQSEVGEVPSLPKSSVDKHLVKASSPAHFSPTKSAASALTSPASRCEIGEQCSSFESAELPAAGSCAPDMSDVAERTVRKFNAETDRWVKSRSVSVAEVQAFCEELKAVSPSRRMECLRRALNLIPDANAALLAGVVLDKTQDREIVEAAFHDIVNRPEEVKEPILKEIAKDKTHPCYSDVEWIYEVTGEKPAE